MSGSSEQAGSLWNFTFGVRIIPDILDRAKWRNTLMWHPHPQITVGVEYNPLADDVHPLANLMVLQETSDRPAVMLGTSSDRIGTPDGQAYFLTVAKDIERWVGLPVAPYAGVSYGTYDDELAAVGGLNVRLNKNLSAMAIFDGHEIHPTLSWAQDNWSIGLILAFGEKLGMNATWRF